MVLEVPALTFATLPEPLKFLYNIALFLYSAAIQTAALWNSKARDLAAGRKHVFSNLSQQVGPGDRIIWVHCSSAGEFEQGKPVIEKLKEEYPHHRILVTFFSPSGMKSAPSYPFADIVSYLPSDTKEHAAKFLETVRPELAVFVKYEFWLHFLTALRSRKIPTILISAVFRKDQLFFRSYGTIFRDMLQSFRHIFVQDQDSLSLLQQHGITHSSISGDTRFDRVVKIAGESPAEPVTETFAQGHQVVVAGSTWPGDEQILAAASPKFPAVKFIIAPHDVSDDHISSIESLFPGAFRYSRSSRLVRERSAAGNIWDHIEEGERSVLLQQFKSARVLIIDNVGMLSRLYRYASVAYVGGGFTRDGIHNILEAAVYEKPVVFGPNYRKYREASGLIDAGGAFSVNNNEQLEQAFSKLLEGPVEPGNAAGNYVRQHTGATANIIQWIQENRLLTR